MAAAIASHFLIKGNCRVRFIIEDNVVPLKRETLADRVYEDLKDLLLSGAMPPGEQLTIRSIAKALGTSPMPVRDAVSRLVAEKAFEIRPNRSILVPALSRDRLEEITTIRYALEGLAAEKAAERVTADELKVIDDYAKKFELFGQRTNPDVAAAIKCNRMLHFSVYRSSRLTSLVEMIESVWLRVGPFFTLSMSNKVRRLGDIEAFGHHRRLIAALKNGDGESARDAVVSDIRDAFQGLIAHGVFDEKGSVVARHEPASIRRSKA